MQFAAALATDVDTRQAVAEVCDAALRQVDGPADLALVFVSPHHGPDFAPIVAEIRRRTAAKCLLGSTGEAIVGLRREVAEQPAIALWLARLPDVSIRPMHLQFERTHEGGTFVGWPDDLPATWPAGSTLLALGEPFSFPADVLLERLAEDQPGVPVLGGMASGAYSPGENQVFLNDQAFSSGAVAVLIHGPVRVRSVVSQGCRPIGRPFVVTKAERQLIHELSGKPALAQLQDVFAELTHEEQQLAQQGLHVGRVINEYQEHFGRGDFLIRNCLGIDRATGAVAVGDFFRPGQTVQFHIRDAATADEDLRELLQAASAAGEPRPQGGLLFTCNGRGTRLFGEADHDAAAVANAWGDLPLAGLFAQGEIGPVGGKNFLHGFTASLALFMPPE